MKLLTVFYFDLIVPQLAGIPSVNGPSYLKNLYKLNKSNNIIGIQNQFKEKQSGGIYHIS